MVQRRKGENMSQSSVNKRPTRKNILSYAVGDLYGGGAFFIIGALFLVFLTDVAKLNPALAGTIILVVIIIGVC